MNKQLIYLVLVAIITAAGCNSGNNEAPEVSEESLGIRDVSLYEEDVLVTEMTSYVGTTPGVNENFDRSFENSPPLIPHTVEGFLPITAKSNICLSCHMPGIAEAVKATAMPDSHFTNYRPEHSYVDDTFERVTEANEVVSEDLGSQMYLGRFNCSQCHVPQANITVAIENTFEAVFRDSTMMKKSNFSETLTEGM